MEKSTTRAAIIQVQRAESDCRLYGELCEPNRVTRGAIKGGIRIAVVRGLLSLCVLGCGIDSLWGYDAPRPALHPEDLFEVVPRCRDLIIDDEAPVPVPENVTLTGKRRVSGLGAEGVPVVVTRGKCAGLKGTDICRGAPSQLPDSLAEAFELVERSGQGCRVRSPSRLDCTLDPRGEASFEVISHLSEDDFTSGTYVPFCVSPLEFYDQSFDDNNGKSDAGGIAEPSKKQEVWVLPRIGNVRIALASLLVAAPEIDVPPDSEADQGTDCRNLYDCDPVRVRATLQAGFVSPDISHDALRTSDFQEVRARQTLKASLQVVNPSAGENAFLSADDSCDKPSDPLYLDIFEGHVSTPVFYLCASGHPATYSIVTELKDTQDGNADSNEASDAEGIIIHPYDFDAPALTKGYVATATEIEDVKSLKTEQCGGERIPTAATGPIRISSPLVTKENQVVIECNTDGDMDDAEVESLTCESKPFPLELTTGQTCNLEIEDS